MIRRIQGSLLASSLVDPFIALIHNGWISNQIVRLDGGFQKLHCSLIHFVDDIIWKKEDNELMNQNKLMEPQNDITVIVQGLIGESIHTILTSGQVGKHIHQPPPPAEHQRLFN